MLMKCAILLRAHNTELNENESLKMVNREQIDKAYADAWDKFINADFDAADAAWDKFCKLKQEFENENDNSRRCREG